MCIRARRGNAPLLWHMWWRVFMLEQYCRLTIRMLKAQQCCEDTIQTFVQSQTLSPFIEELGEAFLQAMSQHSDRLLASVARFEHALLCVKRDREKCYVIDWDYEPYYVLHCLLHGLPLELGSVCGRYQTVVAGNIPGHFQVLTLPT
jgi:hypothetical protein